MIFSNNFWHHYMNCKICSFSANISNHEPRIQCHFDSTFGLRVDFSCDKATLSVVQSVCPSVRLSHIFTMFLSSHHHEILRSDYHWQKWCPCKRSMSKVNGQCQAHTGQNPISEPFPYCNSSLYSHMAIKWCTKLVRLSRDALLF